MDETVLNGFIATLEEEEIQRQVLEHFQKDPAFQTKYTVEQLISASRDSSMQQKPRHALIWINIAILLPNLPQHRLALCYFLRGDIYRELCFHEKALKDYDRAIENDSNNSFSAVYNNRALVLDSFFEQYESAYQDYSKSLQMKLDPVVYFNRALLLEKNLQKYSEAVADINSAISLDPRYARAYNRRALIYETHFNKFVDALHDYNQAIIENRKYKEAFYNRGMLYEMKFQNYDMALRDYTIAIEIDAKYSKVYARRALLYDAYFHRPEQALADYDKAIELDPSNSDARNNRGVLRRDLFRDYVKAHEDFLLAIKNNPKCAPAYSNLAQLLYLENHFCEAKDLARKALEIDPGVARSFYVLALVAHKESQYDESSKYFQKFFEVGHWNTNFVAKVRNDMQKLQSNLATKNPKADS